MIINLSPYEKDRIVPKEFGQTGMGRDLLAEDYFLKQITASLIYPESRLGREFWQKVYAQAQAKYGTTNIPVNTFNKIWIVPERAVVYENKGVAFVLENHLKVMLEEDYLALGKAEGRRWKAEGEGVDVKGINPSTFHLRPSELLRVSGMRTTARLASNIIRSIVIPALTKEVNEGKNFAQLRQVFYSLILATWYKKKIKDSILNKIFANRKKIRGVQYQDSVIASPKGEAIFERTTNDVEAIYQNYLNAFKKGVFSYIKEESQFQFPTLGGKGQGEVKIPRKYFSGGVGLIRITRAMTTVHKIAPDQIPSDPLIEAIVDMWPSKLSSASGRGRMNVKKELVIRKLVQRMLIKKGDRQDLMQKIEEFNKRPQMRARSTLKGVVFITLPNKDSIGFYSLSGNTSYNVSLELTDRNKVRVIFILKGQKLTFQIDNYQPRLPGAKSNMFQARLINSAMSTKELYDELLNKFEEFINKDTVKNKLLSHILETRINFIRLDFLKAEHFIKLDEVLDSLTNAFHRQETLKKAKESIASVPQDVDPSGTNLDLALNRFLSSGAFSFKLMQEAMPLRRAYIAYRNRVARPLGLKFKGDGTILVNEVKNSIGMRNYRARYGEKEVQMINDFLDGPGIADRLTLRYINLSPDFLSKSQRERYLSPSEGMVNIQQDLNDHIGRSQTWGETHELAESEALKALDLILVIYLMSEKGDPLTNPAMRVAKEASGTRREGGINLNPSQMSLQVKEDGMDFKFSFNGILIDAAQLTGMGFTIRQMTPVRDLPRILGFEDKPAQNRPIALPKV